MVMQLDSTNINFYKNSLVSSGEVEFGLAQIESGRKLVVLSRSGSKVFEHFEGEYSDFGDHTLLVGPLSQTNAVSLRKELSWLQPKLLGLHTSAGMGDRLGIATPGHVRAIRQAKGNIAPIFAQQSIREMSRTGRTPQQVMDDATWGIFEESWRAGVGADADHLKNTVDIDACLQAGFTFFTIDPGSYVDNNSYDETPRLLREKVDQLPVHLQVKATGLLEKNYSIENLRLEMTEPVLLNSMAKYGHAIAHVQAMVTHLMNVADKDSYEIEISMDETELPTTPAEHIYITSELHRLGVAWVSFAPRFVGRFEKGVDYIGNIREFEADLAVHASIAKQLGPYKLSLHSGSDKFSIYSIFMEKTQGMAHLKTAGTSYLEALKTIAKVNHELLREIYEFALSRFEMDKQSYHISAQIIRAPHPDKVRDWPALLDQFEAREILHVTFGSVLTEKSGDGKFLFYDRMISILEENRELYFENLQNHFMRHLDPFAEQ